MRHYLNFLGSSGQIKALTSRIPGVRHHKLDAPALATALDALVAILVQIRKVLPKFLVSSRHDVAILDGGELGSQSTDGRDVKFVLVRLYGWARQF